MIGADKKNDGMTAAGIIIILIGIIIAILGSPPPEDTKTLTDILRQPYK
jgi:hypothetical protein